MGVMFEQATDYNSNDLGREIYILESEGSVRVNIGFETLLTNC